MYSQSGAVPACGVIDLFLKQNKIGSHLCDKSWRHETCRAHMAGACHLCTKMSQPMSPRMSGWLVHKVLVFKALQCSNLNFDGWVQYLTHLGSHGRAAGLMQGKGGKAEPA